MARVFLHIGDMANRLTLKTLLEAEGHAIVSEEAEVSIFDQPELAADAATSSPTLLLVHGHLPDAAVNAMTRGVASVIHVPFIPGEAGLMVRRAAGQGREIAPAKGPQEWPSLDQVERDHILSTIRHCRSNYTRAAKLLGIGRNTLWRKLNRYRAEGHLPPQESAEE